MYSIDYAIHVRCYDTMLLCSLAAVIKNVFLVFSWAKSLQKTFTLRKKATKSCS